jgi:hypothetical protein
MFSCAVFFSVDFSNCPPRVGATQTTPSPPGGFLQSHKAGHHAFRRFRNTYGRNYTQCPEGLYKYWMGHAGKDMSDLYAKIKEGAAFRRKWAERCVFSSGFPPLTKAEMSTFRRGFPRMLSSLTLTLLEKSVYLAAPPDTVSMNYPNRMDHLEVLREKIGRLRVEIAQIQELNKQHRLQGRDSAEAQVAHVQRQERLQAIQQELVQLASLGPNVLPVEEMKEKHPAG